MIRDVLERARKVDLAFISVGALANNATIQRLGLIDQTEAESLRKHGAVGDLSVHWLNEQGEMVDHPLNNRAVTMPLDYLKDIPCVMVASGGKDKVSVLHGALRLKVSMCWSPTRRPPRACSRSPHAAAMTGLALGIDIGTTGVRIAATERDASIIAMTRSCHCRAHARFRPPLSGSADLVGCGRNRARYRARQDRPVAHEGHRDRRHVRHDPSCRGVTERRSALPRCMTIMPRPADLARVTAAAPAESAARGGSSPLARALPMQQCAGLNRILHQADWIAGQFSGRFDVTDENNALEDRLRSCRAAMAGLDCRRPA